MKTKHLDASRRQRPNLGLAIGPSGKKSNPAKAAGAGNGCANLPPASATLPPTFPERLLTAKEISPRLFIKPRTAALWARQGRLPAYRIGRKLGFKWEEVEAHLAARCRVTAEDGGRKAEDGGRKWETSNIQHPTPNIQ